MSARKNTRGSKKNPAATQATHRFEHSKLEPRQVTPDGDDDVYIEALDRPFFLQRLNDLLGQTRAALQGSQEVADQVISAKPHADKLESAARENEQREIEGRVKMHQRDVNAIRNALARLEDGSFGISEFSGEPLPYRRLVATPTATRTIAEQAQLESARSRQRQALTHKTFL